MTLLELWLLGIKRVFVAKQIWDDKQLQRACSKYLQDAGVDMSSRFKAPRIACIDGNPIIQLIPELLVDTLAFTELDAAVDYSTLIPAHGKFVFLRATATYGNFIVAEETAGVAVA